MLVVGRNDEAVVTKDGKVLRRAYCEDGTAKFTTNPRGNPLDRGS
jgi:hypothetical protein